MVAPVVLLLMLVRLHRRVGDFSNVTYKLRNDPFEVILGNWPILLSTQPLLQLRYSMWQPPVLQVTNLMFAVPPPHAKYSKKLQELNQPRYIQPFIETASFNRPGKQRRLLRVGDDPQEGAVPAVARLLLFVAQLVLAREHLADVSVGLGGRVDLVLRLLVAALEAVDAVVDVVQRFGGSLVHWDGARALLGQETVGQRGDLSFLHIYVQPLVGVLLIVQVGLPRTLLSEVVVASRLSEVSVVGSISLFLKILCRSLFLSCAPISIDVIKSLTWELFRVLVWVMNLWLELVWLGLITVTSNNDVDSLGSTTGLTATSSAFGSRTSSLVGLFFFLYEKSDLFRNMADQFYLEFNGDHVILRLYFATSFLTFNGCQNFQKTLLSCQVYWVCK